MWVCKYCETENMDAASSCVCCGYKNSAVTMWPCKCCGAENKDTALFCVRCGKKRDAKPRPWKKILMPVFVSLIAALLVAGYFKIHFWAPATCVKPETCSICGIERGSALGHRWSSGADETENVCSRCNFTEPIAAGQSVSLRGHWSAEPVVLSERQRASALELDSDVKNCRKLSMLLCIDEYSGFPYGRWLLYARSLNGDWSEIGEFSLSSDALREEQSFSFSFSPPVSFDALAILKNVDDDYSIRYSIQFYDAQCASN